MLSLNCGMPSADGVRCSAARVALVLERVRPCRAAQRTEHGMFDRGATTSGKALDAVPVEPAGGGPRGDRRPATGDPARPGPAAIIQPGRRPSWVTAGGGASAPPSARIPAQASTRTLASADVRIPTQASARIPGQAIPRTPASADVGIPAPATARIPAQAIPRTPAPASIGIPEPANTRAPEPAVTRVSEPARVCVLAPIPTSVPGSSANPRPAIGTVWMNLSRHTQPLGGGQRNRGSLGGPQGPARAPRKSLRNPRRAGVMANS